MEALSDAEKYVLKHSKSAAIITIAKHLGCTAADVRQIYERVHKLPDPDIDMQDGSPPRLPVERAAEKYITGASLGEASQAYGVTENALRKHLGNRNQLRPAETTQGMVTAILKDAGGEYFSSDQLAEMVDRSRSAVTNVLQKLIKDGTVERTWMGKRNYYRIK